MTLHLQAGLIYRTDVGDYKPPAAYPARYVGVRMRAAAFEHLGLH